MSLRGGRPFENVMVRLGDVSLRSRRTELSSNETTVRSMRVAGSGGPDAPWKGATHIDAGALVRKRMRLKCGKGWLQGPVAARKSVTPSLQPSAESMSTRKRSPDGRGT